MQRVLFTTIILAHLFNANAYVYRRSLIPIVNGDTYTLQNANRNGCNSYVSVSSCADDAEVVFSSSGDSPQSQFDVTPATGGFVIMNRECNTYLAAPSCGYDSDIRMTAQLNPSITTWYLNDVGEGVWNIENNHIRGGCSQVLSSDCSTNGFSFAPGDSQSGSERWIFSRQNSASPMASAVAASTSHPSESPITNQIPLEEQVFSPPPVQTIQPATRCVAKQGVVYDFFFQYCPSVTLTGSAWWLNFDASYDSSCSDPSVIQKHQPMIWGSDRIVSGYNAIVNRPDYAKPQHVMTFNEPNYAYGGGDEHSPSNVMTPQEAAALWPELTSLFDPVGIQLIAPSPIDCSGDPNCRNTFGLTDWLDQFKEALDSLDAEYWQSIHALNYHSYDRNFQEIQSTLGNLYSRYGKPIWIGEIAAGSGASMQENIDLMNTFVPWAESVPWIERYFWNSATEIAGDINVQSSYLVETASVGSGTHSLTALGNTYRTYSSCNR